MENNLKTKKFSGGMKFFFGVLLFYFVLFFIDGGIAKQSLINFVLMIKKIFPLLLIVFLIMILINLFFTKERTLKYLGGDSGIKSWFYAAFVGVLISGPSYVLYPMLGDLKKKGVRDSLLAVFLYNRNVKIPFLPALVYYFGLKYAIVLSFYIIVFSILNGLLVAKFVEYKN